MGRKNERFLETWGRKTQFSDTGKKNAPTTQPINNQPSQKSTPKVQKFMSIPNIICHSVIHNFISRQIRVW